jgi:hypothetical protein
MPLPFAIPLALGAGGMIASAYGARKAGQAGRRAEEGYGRMADEAMGHWRGSQGQADESRRQYAEAVSSFNPQESLNTYLGSAIKENMGARKQAHAGRVANLNSRGLMRSGLGASRMDGTFDKALAGEFARAAFQTAGLEQNRMNAMGGLAAFDRDQSNMHYDAATGLRASGLQQRLAGDAGAAQGWGAIGGAFMGAAGSAAPHADWTKAPRWMRGGPR